MGREVMNRKILEGGKEQKIAIHRKYRVEVR